MRRTPTGCRCCCRITATPSATATSGSASYTSTSDRMMRRAVFVVVTAGGLVAAPLTAQVPARAADMLRRVFASRDFAPDRCGSEAHTAEGQSHSNLESRLLLDGPKQIGTADASTSVTVNAP